MNQQQPLPLEQSDPQLAWHIQQIANGEHPVVQSLHIGVGKLVIYLKSGGANTHGKGPVKVIRWAERNDPCPCGSGRKYKKCCGQ